MGWYLERREAEIDTLTSAEKAAIESQIGAKLDDRLIRLKEGAQAYVATYMRQPELAKKNPKRIFLGATDGGYFDRIFSSDLTAERFVAAHLLAQCVNEYVRQFMTRKRRKDRVPDWRSDYAFFLSNEFVSKHGNVVDQVIPQSAIFLTAVVYELRVVLQGRSIKEITEELGQPDFSILNELLIQTIDFAAADQSFSKSWPTLLKSQAFFEKFASYLKGRISSTAGSLS